MLELTVLKKGSLKYKKSIEREDKQMMLDIKSEEK